MSDKQNWVSCDVVPFTAKIVLTLPHPKVACFSPSFSVRVAHFPVLHFLLLIVAPPNHQHRVRQLLPLNPVVLEVVIDRLTIFLQLKEVLFAFPLQELQMLHVSVEHDSFIVCHELTGSLEVHGDGAVSPDLFHKFFFAHAAVVAPDKVGLVCFDDGRAVLVLLTSVPGGVGFVRGTVTGDAVEGICEKAG